MSTPVAMAAKKVTGRKPPAPSAKGGKHRKPGPTKVGTGGRHPKPALAKKGTGSHRKPVSVPASVGYKAADIAAQPVGEKEFSLGKTPPQRLIVTEFIACVLMIGMTPLVMRKPANGKLYVANDFVRLTAVSLLFFVLALSAAGKRSGPVAAAFGGLVTLGVMFNAAGSIKAIGSIFASTNNGGTVATASAGSATVNAPVYTPFDPLSNPANPQVENPAAAAGITPPKAASA